MLIQVDKGFELRDSLRRLAGQIGNTPLLYIDSLSTHTVQIYAKAEWYQLGNSVKARAAFAIIKDAILSGLLTDKILLDASSGNTAIAYASICAALKIPVEICIPANASQKRKDILEALGAKLHLTSEMEGTDGAQQIARELVASHPERYHYADQYNNPNNWQAHFQGTAQEIWKQSKGSLTHFISGLGTTGTFTGTSKGLKTLSNEIKTIALQPDNPMHMLEGWKHLETAIVPGIFDSSLIDATLEVSSEEALEMIQFIAENEGILLSPSSAANLVGAKKLSHQIISGIITTMLPDDISKYDEVYKMLKRS